MKPEQMLRELLAAWRATYDEALEPLIEQVGLAVARTRGPLEAKNATALEVAWHELAKQRDAADVDRLLAVAVPNRWKAVQARVEALEGFEPDPRITRSMGAVAHVYVFQQHKKLQQAFVRLLARAPTAAIESTIASLGNSVFVAEHYRARLALERLERGAADPALLAAAAALVKPTGDLDALWARHRAEPDDLEHRGVLADALQQAGDPRGEFITAQLAIAAGRGTRELHARVDKLLAANLDTWMGRMPWMGKSYGAVHDEVVFERGFLVALRTNAGEAQMLASIDEPAWATVEELEYMGDGDLSKLVRAQPSLRCITTQVGELDKLAGGGPHPAIRVLCANQRPWWPPAGAFPSLAVLSGKWEIDGRAAAQGHAREAAQHGLHAIVHASVALEAIERIVATRELGPPETRLTRGHRCTRCIGWSIRVRRDDDGADVAWSPSKWDDSKTEGGRVIAALVGGGITAIRLHVPARVKLDGLGAPAGCTVSRDGAPLDLALAP